MAKKIYDLAVAVGKYTSNGEEKNRYVNVGAIIEKDDGGDFISLSRTFNPAGVPNPDNRDTVIISKFAVKDRDTAPVSEHSQKKADAFQAQANDFDDIPF